MSYLQHIELKKKNKKCPKKDNFVKTYTPNVTLYLTIQLYSNKPPVQQECVKKWEEYQASTWMVEKEYVTHVPQVCSSSYV